MIFLRYRFFTRYLNVRFIFAKNVYHKLFNRSPSFLHLRFICQSYFTKYLLHEGHYPKTLSIIPGKLLSCRCDLITENVINCLSCTRMSRKWGNFDRISKYLTQCQILVINPIQRTELD